MSDLNRILFEFLFQWSGQSGFFDAPIVFFGKFFPYFLVLGAIWWLFSFSGWKPKLALFAESAIAIILSRGIITELLHFLYNSPRPLATLEIVPLLIENSNSFPSGHAAFFFALATAIFYYNKRLGWWFFGFAAINGLARVMAGVHWPLDIFGGAIVGITSGLLVHELLKKYSVEIFSKDRSG